MFKNRKLIFLSALLMLVVLIGCASAADVNDIQQVTQDSAGEIITDEVSSAGIDDNYGLKELENENVLNSQNEDSDEDVLGNSIDFTGTTFKELQTQINNCNNGDTINLLGNITQDRTGAIYISKNLTINGNGYTIDAQGKSRIFSISRNDVTLKNIVLINGRVNDDRNYCGGALYITGNNTSIINCTFTNNTAPSQTHGARGGAIYCGSIKGLTISNCTFNNNLALDDGGAIYYERCSNATISNCTFNDNRARYGGAIQFFRSNDTTVSNSTFKNNTACMSTISTGGAIYLRYCNNGNILNCTFTNNNCTGSDATDGGGGAIRINYCNDTTVSNSTFNNNTAWKGGAIHCSSTNRTTIADCNFTNNPAIVPSHTTSKAGAIYYHFHCNDNAIINSNFTNNTAGTGSAIYSLSNVTISDSYFIDNQANADSLTANAKVDGFDVTFNTVFKGKDNLLNAIYIYAYNDIILYDVTYWGADGEMNTGTSEVTPVASADESEDGKLVYKDDREAGINITICIFDENDNFLFNITDSTDIYGNNSAMKTLTAGKYKAYAVHEEDSYYTYIKSKTFEFEIEGLEAFITVDKIVNYTGAVVEVIANVTDANGNPINGGTATFTIHYDNPIGIGLLMANAKEYTTDVIDGKATFENVTLGAPGKYQSTIEYSGNGNYDSASDKSEVEILALNTTVESDDVSGSSGEKTDIVAEIVDQNGKPVQNGTAVLKVNGKEYTAEVKDGKATFKDVELPSEDTEASIEYLGNDYYNPSNTTVQITINEEPQPEPDDGNETEPDTPGTNPEEPGETEGSQTAAMEKTGNPIFLLIVAVLACLPILRRKQ